MTGLADLIDIMVISFPGTMMGGMSWILSSAVVKPL